MVSEGIAGLSLADTIGRTAGALEHVPARMVCPSRILVFHLRLRERVADPSATRVGRVRGSFVFLTMQRTPLPARTSQSSVFVARGSPRPAERSPAQSALPAISLVVGCPSTMPERVPAIARPSGLRTPLRAEAKLDKLPALEAQKRRGQRGGIIAKARHRSRARCGIRQSGVGAGEHQDRPDHAA